MQNSISFGAPINPHPLMKNTPLLLLVILIGFCASCKKVIVPAVETIAYEIVSLDSVLLIGEVTNESDGAVTKRGFYWGTNPTLALTDSSSEDGNGPGVFTHTIGSFILGQEYFFRSYVVDVNGTEYGETLSFKVELNPVMGIMTDSRDGKIYATVEINNQTWMAGNLAFLPSVSPSSEGSPTAPYYYVYGFEGNSVTDATATPNFNTYGVLYNWDAAKIACPSGWHLPTDAEWSKLASYLGNSAGAILKEADTTHWKSPNTEATNASRFTALPAGGRFIKGGYFTLGYYGLFWTATEVEAPNAWYRLLSYNSAGVRRDFDDRATGFPIRCLKD
jgi:uncharacterized protein (TIGR02145 family)